MSSPGPVPELFGQIAYHFAILQPLIPTYLHLVLSALFPIFTGAHASLSRPSSAAKPKRRKKQAEDDSDQADAEARRMEGLSPSDAILYPVLTGCTLTALYLLIKWLKDPEILNKILNWYLSVFGTFSIATLLSSCMSVCGSFIFPKRFTDQGFVWDVTVKDRLVVPRGPSSKLPTSRTTPLPGLLSRLGLPRSLNNALWSLRVFFDRPLWYLKAQIPKVFKADVAMGPGLTLSIVLAVAAVLYFNLINRPWWLTNLLGFSFSYSVLQLMSPTTFWTGTLVLTSLFFYDIYFVFFTPVMIEVATKLDIPVKLLFPRPSVQGDDPAKQSLAMLGLGDVVLPGMMIGMALRFDLYLYYLKKQTKQDLATVNTVVADAGFIKTTNKDPETVVKAGYKPATGCWGERYWLGSGQARAFEGGSFPKTYFWASIFGYIIGIVCTLGVMHVFQHGQPALLYLVPGVLGSLWGTALVKHDIKTMWAYTEAEAEDATASGKKIEKSDGTSISLGKEDRNESVHAMKPRPGDTGHAEKHKDSLNISSHPDEDGQTIGSEKSPRKQQAITGKFQDKHEERFSFSFRLSRPPDVGSTPAAKIAPVVEDGLHFVSKGPVGTTSSDEEWSDAELTDGSIRKRRTHSQENGEPLEKRRRVE